MYNNKGLVSVSFAGRMQEAIDQPETHAEYASQDLPGSVPCRTRSRPL